MSGFTPARSTCESGSPLRKSFSHGTALEAIQAVQKLSYLVDRQGKIAFKSGRGPFGYRPAELAQHVAMHLLETNPAQAARPRLVSAGCVNPFMLWNTPRNQYAGDHTNGRCASGDTSASKLGNFGSRK